MALVSFCLSCSIFLNGFVSSLFSHVILLPTSRVLFLSLCCHLCKYLCLSLPLSLSVSLCLPLTLYLCVCLWPCSFVPVCISVSLSSVSLILFLCHFIQLLTSLFSRATPHRSLGRFPDVRHQFNDNRTKRDCTLTRISSRSSSSLPAAVPRNENFCMSSLQN